MRKEAIGRMNTTSDIGDLDEIWNLYRLLHRAQIPTETVVTEIDTYLRRQWLTGWIRCFGSQLALLGITRIVFDGPGGDSITIEGNPSQDGTMGWDVQR